MASEQTVGRTEAGVSPGDIEHYLSVSALGSELTADETALLAKHTQLARLSDGEVLISEGDQNDYLYAIVKGKFAVMRSSSRGQERLSTFGPGMITGELAFLDGLKRTATVKAEGDECCVITLSRRDLETLLAKNPRIVYKVMRAIIRAAYGHVSKMDSTYTELMGYISG